MLVQTLFEMIILDEWEGQCDNFKNETRDHVQ